MPGVLIHLVRHGAHDAVATRLVGRTPGVVLGAEGRAQAQRLADTLAARPIAAVLSSPQPRARETAEPIAARHGLAVEIAAGLDEIDFGTWQGAAFADLEGDPAWRAWNMARGLGQAPGGETMMAAQARALAVLLDARGRWPDGELVVAGHQDVLRAAMLAALGMPLDFYPRLALVPAGRATLRLWQDGAALEGLDNGA